jgi:hypothetical protein
MTGTTRLSAEGAVGRGLSPAIWQAYGFIGGNHDDPSLVPFFFDDFANLGVYADSTSQGGYFTHQDTGVTFQQAAGRTSTTAGKTDGEFGIMEVAGNDADNDEGYIELGGATAGLVRLDPTAGLRAVVAWEARIKRTSVTNNHTAFAFGIGEPAFAAQDALVADSGALVAAGKDFVGFQTLTASNAEIDTVYKIGGTAATVQVKDNAGTAVADTWQKLGCVYDPLAETDKTMKFFIDGVELGDSVTDAIIATGTAFPTDEEMTLVLLTRNGDDTPAEHKLFMDWWAIGSYYVDT